MKNERYHIKEKNNLLKKEEAESNNLRYYTYTYKTQVLNKWNKC